MFARQMDDLCQWATPIGADFNESLESGVHHVAVTFDDGFQSVVQNAIPELIKRQIPSTIFIPTGYFGRHAQWDTDEGDKNLLEEVISSTQLRELPSDLVSIGSHTVTHRRLTLLEPREARKELWCSKQELASILGRQVKLFSFPYGDYNQMLVGLSREAGYSRVFTILPTVLSSGGENYVAGRVLVSPTDSRLEFRLKLLGAYRWLPLAFAFKRTMRLLVSKCFLDSSARD